MYKIDINNEFGQDTIENLLDTYKKYLEKDIIKLLEKLRYTKQDTITSEECILIYDAYFGYEPLYETLEQIYLKEFQKNK